MTTWDSEPPDIDEALNNLINKPDKELEPVAGIGQLVDLSTVRNHRYARAAFDTEMVRLLGTPEGARNDALNTAAFSLGQLIAAGALEQHEVAATLMAAARSIGLGENEAKATIRSGITAGMKEPRDLSSLEPELGIRSHSSGIQPLTHQTGTDTPESSENAAEADTALYVDLSYLQRGEIREPPKASIGQRSDGQPILYRNAINGIFGEPETAKTWFAQHIGTQTINNGGSMAIIDIDHNYYTSTVARLQMLGLNNNQISDPNQFRLYQPENIKDLYACIDDIRNYDPDLIVLDSVSKFIPMVGGESNNNDDVSKANELLSSMTKGKSAVLTIDHTAKDSGTTEYAIGGSQKKAQTDGLYLYATARAKPAPGTTGRITLKIAKDRYGTVRAISSGEILGTFTLDAESQPGQIITSINHDHSHDHNGKQRPTIYMARISSILEQQTGHKLSLKEIVDELEDTYIGRRNDHQRHAKNALQALVNEGYVQQYNETLNGEKTRYTHIKLFDETMQ